MRQEEEPVSNTREAIAAPNDNDGPIECGFCKVPAACRVERGVLHFECPKCKMWGGQRPMTPQLRGDTREALAAYAHEAWSGWMRYLFEKAPPEYIHGEEHSARERARVLNTGRAVIPAALVQRWQRQMGTPYAALPESEKESDRAEADKILALMPELPKAEATMNALAEKLKAVIHDLRGAQQAEEPPTEEEVEGWADALDELLREGC